MSDSDDEYGPLQATWGSQAPAAAAESAGWDSLKDPNAKLTEKGLGTGQLHRKGKNFKPIDEEVIISQRLQKNSSKKKGSNSRSFSQDNTSTTSTHNHRKTSLPSTSSSQQYQRAKNKQSSFFTPTSPPTRRSSSLAGRISRSAKSNNAWSRPLVDTPFWESDVSILLLFIPLHVILSLLLLKLPNIPSPQTAHQQPSSSPSFQSSSIANNTNNTLNNNNDTHNHHHLHQQQQQQQQSNHGWGKPIPRKPITQSSSTSTTTTAAAAAAAAEQWNPPQVNSNGGWGNVDASSKDGWANKDEKQQQDQGWGSAPRNKAQPSVASSGENGWGSANNDGNSGWGSANKATPSWIDSVPESPSGFSSPSQHRSPEGGKSGSRFSNRSRKKYSDIPIEVPKPRNYDTSEPVSFPTAVAPPPPPENDHLITINVELSATLKIPVPIRELDEPVQLAEKFAAEQNLHSPQVLQAIINLFTSQKDAALLKKRQKLV
jgi:hypothetical protein